MSVKRFLLVTGFALLCGGWAHATTIVPGHFIVDLNDMLGTDSGGWGSGTSFTDTVNTITSTRGFVATTCFDTDANSPNGDEPDCDNDPRISVYGGGASMPFPTSFSSDENGGGTFDFQNDGTSPITDILFTTNFVPGDSYTCSTGSPMDQIFAFCGFKIVDIGGVEKLEILFDKGSIPSVPEPAEYLPLLIAGSALVLVHHLRFRRVSN